MATIKRKETYKKAIIISLIAAVICILMPIFFASLDPQNDWRSVSSTVDNEEYILINPSVSKSIGLAFKEGKGIIWAIVGAVIAGAAIGFGSQDQLPISIGGTEIVKAKNDIFVMLGLIVVGILISWTGGIFGPANSQKDFTTYTVKQKDFNIRAAKRGKYDSFFTKFNQPDPVKEGAFPRRAVE